MLVIRSIFSDSCRLFPGKCQTLPRLSVLTLTCLSVFLVKLAKISNLPANRRGGPDPTRKVIFCLRYALSLGCRTASSFRKEISPGASGFFEGFSGLCMRGWSSTSSTRLRNVLRALLEVGTTVLYENFFFDCDLLHALAMYSPSWLLNPSICTSREQG